MIKNLIRCLRFKVVHTIHNAILCHKVYWKERLSCFKSVTRPTVSLEPFCKIRIDLGPLSKFSDKITLLIEF